MIFVRRPIDGRGRKRNGGGRVAAHRLPQQVGRRQLRQLVQDQVGVPAVGDDEHVIDAHQRGQAGDRGLEQRGVPQQGQERLGRAARLSGQSRVPPPPAMITAYIGLS